MLEAALAGCRLLLSDIRHTARWSLTGLRAELLSEPLSANLTAALARPAKMALGDQQANQTFISRYESGSAKLTELELHYRKLVSEFSR